jgi:CO/xanthine dehydrogenase FAD-binding subunit
MKTPTEPIIFSRWVPIKKISKFYGDVTLVYFPSKGENDELVERILDLDKNFFTGYRQNAMLASEVLVYVDIPATTERDFVAGYKQAKRRDDDIAIVNAGFRVRFEEDRRSGDVVVAEACLAFGGMAAKTVRASLTEAYVTGRYAFHTVFFLSKHTQTIDVKTHINVTSQEATLVP